MKNYFRSVSFILLLFICTVEVNAQSFPATEAEVKEILCEGKWVLDSAGMPGKMTTAKDAMMEDVVMVFKNDGTYTITMFEMDRKGKWTVDMNEKQVKIFEKKPEPESIIKKASRGRIEVVQTKEEDFMLLFKQAK